jgi:hypothetical protein
MAISRKDALTRIQEDAVQVELHLAKIVANPDAQALSHWKWEIRNWLRKMEALLPHVGKKTSAKWQARIDTYRAQLES